MAVAGLRVTSFAFIALLLGSLLTVQSMNRNLWITDAYAQAVTFTDLNSANGQIFYLSAENREPLEIAIQNGAGAELSHDAIDHLPSGIWLTPETETAQQFVIHIDNAIKVDPARLPISYGVNFIDRATSGASASVLFVVEGPHDQSSSSVSFDADEYSVGDQATITVRNPHFYCKLSNSDAPIAADSAENSVVVTVKTEYDGSEISGSPFTVFRDLNANDEFRRTITIPAGLGRLMAEYVPPVMNCVYPSEPEDPVIDIATVGTDKISLDKLNYIRRDNAKLTALDDATVPNKVSLSAIWTNGTHTQEIEIPDSHRSVTLLGAPSPHVFTSTLSLEEVLPLENFPNNDFQDGYVTITATYGEPGLGDQFVFTVVPDQKLSFIIPDGRAFYFTNDTLSIALMDPSSNANNLEFDTKRITLCSYNSGNLIDNAITRTTAAEIGRNTASFVNSYRIAFIDPFYSIDLTGNELEIFSESAVRVLTNGPTQVLARLIDSCPDTLPTSIGPMEAVVTVEPSDDATAQAGRGQNVGAVAHRNPPYYSISQVNCGQYNYGPDSDQDGICDNWETTSGLKLYYPAGGSSYTFSYTCDPCPKPDHKDMFVEVDYVNNAGISGCNDGRTANTGDNYQPSTTALNNVETAFRAAPVTNNDGVNGIELHFYLDDDVWGGCLEKVSVWGNVSNPNGISFDLIKSTNFGRDDTERLLEDDRGRAKFQVFHYVLSVPMQGQDTASSGVAEQLGNDIVVSLGASGIGWSTTNMAGTLMHELGHNLGLYHGGPNVMVGGVQNDYNVNCKPNYPSVMTYIRQLANPYSNNTLMYSDDYLDPSDGLTDPLIRSDDPNELQVLRLTASSWMSLVELVWGIDPGAVGGPITVLSGDATQFEPDIPGDVRKTTSNIDWDGSSIPDNGNNAPGASIANLGIPGCSGSDTDTQISGADDWANLKYDFRTLNPNSFETGFADLQFDPLELNSTIMRDIRVKGISTTDFLIENLDNSKIIDDSSCRDVVFTPASNSTNYDVGDTIGVEIADGNANKDPDNVEFKTIKASSTSNPVGVEFDAAETGEDTGIFTLEVETSAASEADKLMVSNGDLVTIEYTDACSGYPVKGWDFKIVVKIGSNFYNITSTTLAEKVKDEFHSKLVSITHADENDYVTGSASNATLIQLIMEDNITGAIRELLTLRQYMDGASGGNKTNDLFEDDWETTRALRFLDNNIASLKEANNTAYEESDPFVVTTFDRDCSQGNLTLDVCIVEGYSETATTSPDTFQFDDAKKRMTLDLVGQGNLTLRIPTELASTVYFVRSNVHGGTYPFTLTNNGSYMSLAIEDLSPTPRRVAVFTSQDLVSPSSIMLQTNLGAPLAEGTKGEQALIAFKLNNYGEWMQNFTALVQVRYSNGSTESLQMLNGTLGPEGDIGGSVPWTPPENGEYTIRIFVIFQTSRHAVEILSNVEERIVNVNE